MQNRKTDVYYLWLKKAATNFTFGQAGQELKVFSEGERKLREFSWKIENLYAVWAHLTLKNSCLLYTKFIQTGILQMHL